MIDPLLFLIPCLIFILFEALVIAGTLTANLMFLYIGAPVACAFFCAFGTLLLTCHRVRSRRYTDEMHCMLDELNKQYNYRGVNWRYIELPPRGLYRHPPVCKFNFLQIGKSVR